VLTSIGTVKADDPRLTARDVETARQPLRVIVDSNLEIPLAARALADGNALVACARENAQKADALRALGVEVLCLPNAQGRVDLPALMRALGERGINETLTESGMLLNGALAQSGCVDEFLIYYAPILLGDTARAGQTLGTARVTRARPDRHRR